MIDSYVRLAKLAVEDYLKSGRIINPSADLPQEMLTDQAGVFVSIHKKPRQPINVSTHHDTEGELRGCIGTFLPTKENIAREIIDNAIAAGSRDYRFPPIASDELADLEISVDVLSEPEPITNQPINLSTRQPINQLDPKKYGVIVKTSDGRTGLLLPDLEGIDDPEMQIQICREKAGILQGEPIFIYRFTVTRHKER